MDAAAGLVCTKSIDLYEKHGIFRRKELEARYNIRLVTYVRTLDLEARTMLDMAKRQIIPAVIGYTKYLADCVCAVQSTGLTVDMSIESSALKDVAAAGAQLKTAVSKLEKALEKAATIEDVPERARAYRGQGGHRHGGAAGSIRPAGNAGQQGILAHPHLFRPAVPGIKAKGILQKGVACAMPFCSARRSQGRR